MRRQVGGRLIRGAILSLALCAVLAACGGAQRTALPNLPGGTYTSAAYHFRVTYPEGWSLSANSCASGGATCSGLGAATATTSATQTAVPVPLQLIIARTSQGATPSPTVSTLTITVLSLSDPYVAKAAAQLAQDHNLHQTTISGLAAFASAPTQQQLPSPGGTPGSGTPTDTHTDYYLVHGGYEYQISMDALSSDSGADQALQAMLQGFTITA
jgi:hypothetical protein